jgi:hypothetical protein
MVLRASGSRWRLALAAALLALLGGCSLVGIAYENADLWLLHEAEDYVALRPAQRDQLKVALKSRLEQHRTRELPRYVEFLDEALAAASDGLTPTEVETLLGRLQGLAAELVAGTVPPVAAALAGLDDAQRAQLAERLRAGDRRYEEDYVLPARDARLAKRAKAARKQLAHWTGDLTPGQRERVAELVRAWPDVAGRWLAYRKGRTDGLVALLQRGAGKAEIERYLESRWVRHEGQPADLERDVAATRSGIVALVVALDGSLSPAQRKALLDRIRGYRADLAALLPRGAPVVATTAPPEAAAVRP